MACDWFLPKSRWVQAGIDTFLYTHRAREACCWSWWKPQAEVFARHRCSRSQGANMLLLAADTSGQQGSIALARCGPGDACNLIEPVPLAGGTFSAQLVPHIAGLLAKHGFDKQDIDALAVTSGPGSFTGL